MNTKAKRPAWIVRVGMAHRRLFMSAALGIATMFILRSTGLGAVARMLIGWDVGGPDLPRRRGLRHGALLHGRGDQEERVDPGRRRVRDAGPCRRGGGREPWRDLRRTCTLQANATRTTASTSRWPSSPWSCRGPSSTPSLRCTTPRVLRRGRARQRLEDSPMTIKPDYWDFVYFSFVVGMTFQVSDVAVTHKSAPAHGRGAWRAVVLLHAPRSSR